MEKDLLKLDANRTGYSPVYSYNTCIKMSGREVTLKRYQKRQIKGYGRKTVGAGTVSYEYIKKSDFEEEQDKQARFYKSITRAKEMIFDVVGCNAGEWKTPDNKKQKVKFVTLTFAGKWLDVRECNYEFTKFIKRLNDALFCNGGKSVLKYICIPELQGRGTWHYHVVFFNLPPIPQSLRKAFQWCEKGWLQWGKWDNLTDIWGLGYVGINVVDNTTRAAAYISKYLAKGINVDMQGNVEYKSTGDDDGTKRLGDYSLYSALGLENMKRYFCSRGLLRPIKRYVIMTKEQHKTMFSVFQHNLIALNKDGAKVKKKVYENEYRGSILIYNFRLIKSYMHKYVQMIDDIAIDRTKRFASIPSRKYDWRNYKVMRDRAIIAKYNLIDMQQKIEELIPGKCNDWLYPVYHYINLEEIFA